jgi:pantetheine-phosphate adenylyltransferase
MKRALICGSFDPPTIGHIDIIRRTAAIFDEVVVSVCYNSEKAGTYPHELRVEMLRRSLSNCSNVKVDLCTGLVADYAVANDIDVIVKGVRNAADYDYEAMIAQVNLLNAPIETLFLPADPAYQFISSTVAREMIRYGRALDRILPPEVIEMIQQ